MKIRKGFVTNSSSASYTVHFKSALPVEDIVLALMNSDRLTELVEKTFQITEKSSSLWVTKGCHGLSLFKKSNGTWTAHDSTTMYNDEDDLILNHFVNRLKKENNESIKIIKTIWSEDDNSSTICYFEDNKQINFFHVDADEDWEDWK